MLFLTYRTTLLIDRSLTINNILCLLRIRLKHLTGLQDSSLKFLLDIKIQNNNWNQLCWLLLNFIYNRSIHPHLWIASIIGRKVESIRFRMIRAVTYIVNHALSSRINWVRKFYLKGDLTKILKWSVNLPNTYRNVNKS